MRALIALFVISIPIFICNRANAQGKATVMGGLYLTSNDFVQQKLTYQIDCIDPKDKIKPNDLFGSSTGYVLSKGEKHEFNKRKVYGYRTCENKNYRFFNNLSYLLVDTGGFYVYYQYRSNEHVKDKGLSKKGEYFFSKEADGDLHLLTIVNLKNSFPDNHNFHYALDANFKSDAELMDYDSFQKNYKVKYLYNQSKK